jgi:kynurenine formamidase
MRMKLRVLAVAVLLIGPFLGAAGTAQSGPDSPSGRTAFKKEDYFRWMKELSNWGRWGAADEVGTLNLITPEKMRQAATLVRIGTSVSLAEVQVPNVVDQASPYSGKPYSMSANVEEFGRNAPTQPFTSPPPEDLALSAHGGRTHVDALAHMFYNGQGYNGLSYKEITGRGAGRGSIDKLRNGIVTRGVLVDVPRLKGVPYLPDSAHVTVQDLQDWEKRSGVKVSEGDALFVRVGHWARRRATSDRSHRSAGLDPSVIPWLRERGVAVLGSEGAHDVMPSDYQLGPAPVHWFTLVFLGMTLMDYLDLDPLSEVAAKNKRWEFLVTIAPMPIVGATGSPVNPIAVF